MYFADTVVVNDSQSHHLLINFPMSFTSCYTMDFDPYFIKCDGAGRSTKLLFKLVKFLFASRCAESVSDG